MFTSREGQSVPQANFYIQQDGHWQLLSSEDLFKHKNVVLFSLPGAFTPTCSSTHLPRYNELADIFKAQGIDDIICISVNDSFVMNEWKQGQKAENITFIPDGNGEFTEKMGMLVDKSELGFGKRSWRYSMLVKDGIIEKMFIEPELPGDPFEVSDADTMLDYLTPEWQEPVNITVITKPGCPHCARAKALLQDKGLSYEEIVLGQEGHSYTTLRALSGQGTVPQVFMNGSHIGGADQLTAHLS